MPRTVAARAPFAGSTRSVSPSAVTVQTTMAPLPDPTAEPARHTPIAKVPADRSWLWRVSTPIAPLAAASSVPSWIARRRISGSSGAPH